MSNIDTMLEITCTNQDLFDDLNDKSAETISGGYEVFTVKNETKYNIHYFIDGTLTKPEFAKPNTSSIWTAHKGGIIKFDVDRRSDYKQWEEYNLANGGVYAFRDNTSTSGNPYDIELYSIA